MVKLLFGEWTQSGPPRGYTKPPAPDLPDTSSFFLLANASWNDYGFRTDFIVHGAVGSGEWAALGSISTGMLGQEAGPSTFQLLGSPAELAEFPEQCFSIGDSYSFYENLCASHGVEPARSFLRAVRDVALADGDRYNRITRERVWGVSLTRGSGWREVLDKAPGLFGGEGRPLREAFQVRVELERAVAPIEVAFDFKRDSAEGSRLNVLVGLNGSGKTQTLVRLSQLLSRVFLSNSGVDVGGSVEPEPSVYGVVVVSFSAFDDFDVPDEEQSDRFRYAYCGLRSASTAGDSGAGSSPVRGERVRQEVLSRWNRLEDSDIRLRALEPLRPSLDLEASLDEFVSELPVDQLSAGQRIVLSITCELLLNVRDRTLVMMDEPELHLHPQLLSSLMAWVTDLLVERDSFAIVATHSPSVVQQVRRSSVHVFRRFGDRTIVTQPEIETFGANLTDIAHEVFQDREGDRSYQDILRRLFAEAGSVDAVNQRFDNRLGMNAVIFLRSLAAKNQ